MLKNLSLQTLFSICLLFFYSELAANDAPIILPGAPGEESKNLDLKTIKSVKDEVADIFIYLIRIADKLNIDIEQAINHKIEKNAIKYPIKLSKNNAIKYNKRDS